MKRIAILGSSGMLGSMCAAYFKNRNFDVLCFDERWNKLNYMSNVHAINAQKPDILINCVGKIPQKNHTEYYFENAVLPSILARNLDPLILIVQPSTDCVFSGDSNLPYKASDPFNATDDYGLSKALGELGASVREKSIIMRTSIIGPNKISSTGLFEWVKKQRHKKINGFCNHYWSGITTLEWCIQLESALIEKQFGLLQIGLHNPISKYELIKSIIQIFEIPCELEKFCHPETTNKALYPNIISKPLSEQLEGLRDADFINIDSNEK